MLWPNGSVTQPQVSSPFGMRYHPVTGQWRLHAGVDFIGFSEVRAVADGTVVHVGRRHLWEGGGVMVWVQHDGFLSRYLHLKDEALPVRVGQWVTQGTVLGVMGMTGTATGVHVHLEIEVNGQQVDPVPFIRERIAAQPAGGGSTTKPASSAAKRRRRREMSVGVFYTNEKSDQERSGVIIDGDNNLVSQFGWFPESYAHNVAQGFGLERAGKLTRGHYNVLVRDALERAAAAGNVTVDGEIAVIGEAESAG